MKGKLIFGAAGTVCLLYGITVISIIGTGDLFSWFYPVLGAVLLAVSVFWPSDQKRGVRGRKIFSAVAAFCAAVFLVTEAGMFACGKMKPESSADYVILLGTQVRPDGPSVEYRARLEEAYAYLLEDPGSMLIATGGKGSNEVVSEAEGARQYLSRKGISEERIILEDRSVNTAQNLTFAAEILKEMGEDPGEIRVVIVSSEFHLLRARYLASRLGFSHVSSTGSRGVAILLPHFYTREFFALVKDVLTFRP